MRSIPADVLIQYRIAMSETIDSDRLQAAYIRWLRFYLDFCAKYQHTVFSRNSRTHFIEKLASKRQSKEQQSEAFAAVTLYLTMLSISRAANKSTGRAEKSELPAAPASRLIESPRLSVLESRAFNATPRVSEESGPRVSWETEFDALHDAIRIRNYSAKTGDSYRFWAAKFQAYVKSKPASQLTASDVKAFLTDLAVTENVAASTQNQAFNALLFFFRHVLGREFGRVGGVVRAKRRPYIPVTLSREEVDRLLNEMCEPYRTTALLMYACGLRLSECLELRIQCFNFDAMLVTIHDGKGQKDRTIPLPAKAVAEIKEQIDSARRVYEADLSAGYAGVFLPKQLERKYKNAAREWTWQWFLPAANLTEVPGKAGMRRYHLHDQHVQAAVKAAACRAGIAKRVTPHTFRHTFASHLLLARYDIQTIQKLLGHSDVRITMIYLQTVPSLTLKETRSPLDL